MGWKKDHSWVLITLAIWKCISSISLILLFPSPCRPCRSPTWQECCPGTLAFAATFQRSCVAFQPDSALLLILASTTPSPWCCVWASQQPSASWWRSSASKQRFARHNSFYRSYSSHKHLNLNLTNHSDGCDVLPRCALHLLLGDVPLWSRAGHHPPISICKYRSTDEHSKRKVWDECR